MKSKLSVLGCVLILSALIFGGCAPSTARRIESPTVGPAPAEGSATPTAGQLTATPTSTEAPTETATATATATPTKTATEAPPLAALAEMWVYVDFVEDRSQPENLHEGTTVTWVDIRSGDANSVPAPGMGHQVVGEWVYYEQVSYQGGLSSTVHRVNAAGQDERFNFMDIPEDDLQAVHWAISPDGTQIVWMRGLVEQGAKEVTLTSDLYVAAIATGETRLLTTYVTHENRFLAPWGFSPDGSQVFVYLRPYGIGGMWFRCGAFSLLDVATGQLTPLPDPVLAESFPGPAAALSDDGTRLARLPFSGAESEVIQISLTDLTSGQTTEIATTISTDPGFVQVGDGVFSPDGSTLIYTVAYGDWGSEGYALFQVDLATGTQRELLAPQSTHYRVARFEDDGSLLLTIAWPGEGAGTFRLYSDGALEHLSDLTFLGVSR